MMSESFEFDKLIGALDRLSDGMDESLRSSLLDSPAAQAQALIERMSIANIPTKTERMQAAESSQSAASGGHGPAPISNLIKGASFKIGSWKTSLDDLAKKGLVDQKMIDGVLARVAGSSAGRAATAALAGGVAIPLLAAGAVVTAAVALADAGSASNRRISSAYYAAGGGNGKSTIENVALAGLFGTDAAGMASLATNLGEKLRGGGYGPARLRAAGIQDLGYRTLDKFENVTKTIDFLRTLSDDDALMVSRDAGVESLLPARDLSNASLTSLRNSMGGTQTKDARIAATEYDVTRSTVGNNIDNAYRAVAGPVMRSLNFAFDLARFQSNPLPFISRFMDQDLGKDKKNGKGSSDPLKENTEAIKEMSRVVKDQRELIGGGPRGKIAYDNLAWKGMMFDEANRSHAHSLGVFAT